MFRPALTFLSNWETLSYDLPHLSMAVLSFKDIKIPVFWIWHNYTFCWESYYNKILLKWVPFHCQRGLDSGLNSFVKTCQDIFEKFWHINIVNIWLDLKRNWIVVENMTHIKGKSAFFHQIDWIKWEFRMWIKSYNLRNIWCISTQILPIWLKWFIKVWKEILPQVLHRSC